MCNVRIISQAPLKGLKGQNAKIKEELYIFCLHLLHPSKHMTEDACSLRMTMETRVHQTEQVMSNYS